MHMHMLSEDNDIQVHGANRNGSFWTLYENAGACSQVVLKNTKVRNDGTTMVIASVEIDGDAIARCFQELQRKMRA
jgi:hypothetical protein